jgi:hypothetical protein
VQQAATAATDTELSNAVATINSSLAGKQDAATAATDTELGTAFPTIGHLAARPTAAAFGRGYYWADDDNGGTLYFSNGAAWTKLSPGIAEPAGLELGYAEITAAPAGITAQAATDIAGVAVTVTVGTRPIRVIGEVDNAANSIAGGAIQFSLREGNTQLAAITATSAAAGAVQPIGQFSRRLAPTPGQHTYKMSWQAVYAGTVSAGASATDPISIQVITC